MQPVDHDLKNVVTRTDVIVGIITAVILIVTTAWLILLLF